MISVQFSLNDEKMSAVRCNPQYPHRVLVDAAEGRVWTIEIIQ